MLFISSRLSDFAREYYILLFGNICSIVAGVFRSALLSFFFRLMMFSIAWGSVRQPEAFILSSVLLSAVTVAPGSTVTCAFMAVNRTDETQWYDPVVILPYGWKQIIPEVPFSISPRDTVIRLLVFSVPSAAVPLEYTVIYRLRDRAKDYQQTSVPVTVIIPVTTGIELSLSESPKFSIAGTVFITDVLLKNRGNALCAVTLTLRSSHGYPVSMDTGAVILRINETRRIRIAVATDENADRSLHTLEIEAVPDADPSKRQRISAQVEIVSREPNSGEKYREFPLLLRFREVIQNGIFLPQGEISGSGSLNSAGTDRLTVLIRTPETQSVSLLGQRDEYRISYRKEKLSLTAGDQNFTLSPLTEAGRSATGLGGKFSSGNISAGAFYNETRWISPSFKEAGGFVNYRLTKDAAFGINLLRKDEHSVNNIATVRSMITPMTGTTLDLEFGRGMTGGTSGNAYSVRMEGTQRWISYDLRYISAGHDFDGYYRDMNFLTSNLTVRAGSDVRFMSYAAVEQHNRSRDSVQLNAPKEEHYQFGAAYTDAVSLYYKYVEREELFDSLHYRIIERSLQSRFGLTFTDASLYLNAEYGIRRDLFNVNSPVPFARVSLFHSLQTEHDSRFSNSVEYETIRDTVSGREQARTSATVNANIDLGSSLQLYCYLYASRLYTSPRQTIGVFESSLQYHFPFNHSIQFRARLSTSFRSAVPNDIAYSLEYAIPLSIPYERISDVGVLRGMLKDESGSGIPDALLFIADEAAVTDIRGAFMFPGLIPGDVYLSIDKSTIGLHNTTSELMPMLLHIRGGEETVIALSVRKSVSLSGTVELYGVKERSVLDSLTLPVLIGGREDVNLQLTNGEEILRRVSDNKGGFEFDDLRAGVWTLTVSGGAVPEYHTVEPDSSVFRLKPGDHKNIILRIVPDKRSLKMQQN